jgi:hypothetical protein
MTHRNTHSVAGLSAVLLCGLFASHAHARGANTAPVPAGVTVAPALVNDPSVARVLVNDRIQTGEGDGMPLVAGYNDIDDSFTIKCANAAGCTLSMLMNVQVSLTSGQWCLSSSVDGIMAYPGCSWQGSLPAIAGSYVNGSRQVNIEVATGTHTVQHQVYLEKGGVLGQYQIDTMIYKP